MNRKRWTSLLAIVLTTLAAFGVVELVDDDGDGRPDRISVPLPKTQPDRSPAIPESTAVDGADADAKRDDQVRLSEQAENVAQDFVEDPKDLERDPGDPPLAGTGKQVGVGVIPAPMAADEIDGCRTRFLKTNFSARGVAPSQVVLFELHYTAGSDLPNSRAEVDGLTAYGNQPSSRVSWHFNLDKDGNCDYNVPLRLKAWTIADLNPYTINVEVHGKGEAPYLREAGYRKLASIIRQVRVAYPGIKLQLGAAHNCRPTRGGLDTHWRGGACSGAHSDIRPHDLAKVIAKIRALLVGPAVTRTDRLRCAQIRDWRRAGRPSGPDNPSTPEVEGVWERKSVWRRKALEAKGLRCTDRGVVPA